MYNRVKLNWKHAQKALKDPEEAGYKYIKWIWEIKERLFFACLRNIEIIKIIIGASLIRILE